MPEGHTVHRSARDLRALAGRPVRATSPQGRFPEASVVDSDVLEATDAHGKHLLLHFAGGKVVHVHLGMKGVWLRSAPDALPIPQARLRLAGRDVAWSLVAPARCELLSPDGATALVATLGPDPLRPDSDVEAALRALGDSTAAVGAALLDQSVVSGVGNVFRAEALHAIGVHPTTPSRVLGRPALERLWSELERMMARAVEDGRIITVDVPDRQAVPEAEARRVYKQERCRDCAAAVVVGRVGGRTSYHCPVEQPEPTGRVEPQVQ